MSEMPVIRGQANINVLPADRRAELVQQLKQELEGNGTDNGPVIYLIPLDRSNRLDIVVVWDAFQSIASEDRSGIIEEAYGGEEATISLALGVTYEEALEQQVLPYVVVPKDRRDDVDPVELWHVMLEQGGITTRQGGVDLRFPTMAMAEEARRRLCDRLPNVRWGIVQSPGSSS
jgi:hypothetical protein